MNTVVPAGDSNDGNTESILYKQYYHCAQHVSAQRLRPRRLLQCAPASSRADLFEPTPAVSRLTPNAGIHSLLEDTTGDTQHDA